MKTKLCIIVSSNMTIRAFMINHLRSLVNYFDISVIVDQNIDFKKEYNLDIEVIEVFINRKINILEDIKSLHQIYNVVNKRKFDVILSITPKAGLLAMMASYIAKTKVRIHFFTGQVWATKTGFFKIILKLMDKIIASSSTHILVDSESQREFIVKEGIVDKAKSSFLHKGSISGVDLEKFKKDSTIRNELRVKYNITNELVFMFLGRLNKDKGILDLASTFNELFDKYQDIKLFLVGPDEDGIEEHISKLLENKNVVRLGYVTNPEEILNLSDILVLPSYREGFGTIVIEAAAMRIPTIGSNIYGLSDAIIDNETGALHKKADLLDMKMKYEELILNRDLVKLYAENAYTRAVDDFNSHLLSRSLLEYLLKVIR